jgi:hypothetical protein
MALRYSPAMPAKEKATFAVGLSRTTGYPKPTAPDSSASSFAAKVGGGLDLKVSHHVSIRLVEANWLRTQLPNATANVQNDLELGGGIVFHTGARQIAFDKFVDVTGTLRNSPPAVRMLVERASFRLRVRAVAHDSV